MTLRFVPATRSVEKHGPLAPGTRIVGAPTRETSGSDYYHYTVRRFRGLHATDTAIKTRSDASADGNRSGSDEAGRADDVGKNTHKPTASTVTRVIREGDPTTTTRHGGVRTHDERVTSAPRVYSKPVDRWMLRTASAGKSSVGFNGPDYRVDFCGPSRSGSRRQ